MRNFGQKLKCFTDAVSGGIILVVCIILYTQTFSIKKFAMLSDSVGPRFFPRVVLVVLALLGVLLIIGGIIKGSRAVKELVLDKSNQADNETGSSLKTDETKKSGSIIDRAFSIVDTNEKVRAVISILGMFVMVLLMPSLGYAVSATLYLFVQFTLLAPQEKRWKRLWLHAVLAVFFGIGTYFLFRYAIQINLPAGILKNIF